MRYREKLEEITKETEEIVKENRKGLEEEVGEFEHAELETVKPENSEEASRHAQLLDFYNKRLELLERAQENLQELEAETIESRKEELDENHPRSVDDCGIEGMKSSRASLLLTNAAKLVKGEEYDLTLGGRESKTRNSKPREKTAEDGGELEELREKYVKAFLNSSSLLRIQGDLKGYVYVKEKDLEQKKEIDQEIDKLRDDLKQRAEDINAMLPEASEKLEELESISQD